MSLTDGFFQSLERYYINGRLADVSRRQLDLAVTNASSAWLPVHLRAILIKQPVLTEDQRYHVLQGLAQFASIILGTDQHQTKLSDQDAAWLERPTDNTVVISYQPILKPLPGFTILDSLDVITGQIIHDAGYLRERQPTDPAIEKNVTYQTLYQLVEDLIIDAILTLQYPGFEAYLLRHREYMVDRGSYRRWGSRIEGRLAQTITALRSTKPTKTSRKSVRQAYFYMLYILGRNRSIEQLRSLDRNRLTYTLYTLLYSERIYAHWGMVNHRSERFVLGKDGPPEPGDNGENRGGNELNPVTDQLLDHPDETFMKQWEELPDSDPPIERPVTRKFHLPQLKKNDRLLENLDMVQTPTPQGSDRTQPYHVRITVPPYYYHAAERYRTALQAVQPYIDKLQKQFTQIPTPVQVPQYGLQSGRLDEDALYQVNFSNALFMKPITDIRLSQKLNIVAMIDTSSSMREKMSGSDLPRYVVAQQMAVLFVEALERIDDVRTWVYTYSSKAGVVNIHERYSPASQGEKHHIGDIYPWEGQQTPEYEALSTIMQHMTNVALPHARMIYLVISDGEPDDDILSRQEQIEKIRKLVIGQQKQGHLTIHLSLNESKHAHQIYPNSIPFPKEGYPAFIHQFGQLLYKLVKHK